MASGENASPATHGLDRLVKICREWDGLLSLEMEHLEGRIEFIGGPDVHELAVGEGEGLDGESLLDGEIESVAEDAFGGWRGGFDPTGEVGLDELVEQFGEGGAPAGEAPHVGQMGSGWLVDGLSHEP